MLVLMRHPGEVIDVTLEDGRRIEITICGIVGARVRVGIDAPRTVLINRREITELEEACGT